MKSVADVRPATQARLLSTLAQARGDGLIAEADGSGLQASVDTGGTSELVGIAIAAVVLVITFGSLVAAGLPLLTALIGVGYRRSPHHRARQRAHHRHHHPRCSR